MSSSASRATLPCWAPALWKASTSASNPSRSSSSTPGRHPRQSSPPDPLSILERGNSLTPSQLSQLLEHLHHRPRIPLAVVQQILPHPIVPLLLNLLVLKKQ